MPNLQCWVARIIPKKFADIFILSFRFGNVVVFFYQWFLEALLGLRLSCSSNLYRRCLIKAVLFVEAAQASLAALNLGKLFDEQLLVRSPISCLRCSVLKFALGIR